MNGIVKDRLDGKVCLVTGASSGIGSIVALELARRGATLVLLCRNEQKGADARLAITEQTGNQDVHLLWADLTSQRQLRSAMEQFRTDSRFPHLHLLVNNAGMLAGARAETEDGIEQTLAVNHLAPFVLTLSVLDKLRAAGEARVVNVSSEVHRWVKFDIGNLQMRGGYGGYKAYCLSKLAIVMFTRELARRVANTGIAVNCVHPGVISSNFGHGASWKFRTLMSFSRPFLRSPRSGAQTILHLACSGELDGVSGEYFNRRRRVQPSAFAMDDELCRQLWRASEELTGMVPPAWAA